MRNLLLGTLAVGAGACLVACSGMSPQAAAPSTMTSSTSPGSPSSSSTSTPPSSIPTTLSCPATVSSEGTLGNIDAPVDRLVPANPLSGLLCRYYPIYGTTQPGYPHGHLEGDAVLDAPTARRLATILDGMPRPPAGPQHCPADFGTIDLVTFGFGSRPPLTVRGSLTGCPTFTNGRFLAGSSTEFVAYTALVDALVARHDHLP